MFTGLVEEKGMILRSMPISGGIRLEVASSLTAEIGDSISINGCCLTVVALSNGKIDFELSEETIAKTTFKNDLQGVSVNMERAILPTTRLGGHLVTGHIDCTGRVIGLCQRGAMLEIEIQYPQEFAALLVPKGSITVNGVSLTLNHLKDSSFSFMVTIIPKTLEVTTLSQLHLDDFVNLEFDILGKYARRHKEILAPS